MNIGDAKINDILVGKSSVGSFLIKVTEISIFKPIGRIRGDILHELPNQIKQSRYNQQTPPNYVGRTFVFPPSKVREPTKEELSFLK